jgi:hypothetical protein
VYSLFLYAVQSIRPALLNSTLRMSPVQAQ